MIATSKRENYGKNGEHSKVGEKSNRKQKEWVGHAYYGTKYYA